MLDDEDYWGTAAHHQLRVLQLMIHDMARNSRLARETYALMGAASRPMWSTSSRRGFISTRESFKSCAVRFPTAHPEMTNVSPGYQMRC